MACKVQPKCDALKCTTGVLVPEVNGDSTYFDISAMLNLFSLSDLKTMFFLLMTDLGDKKSLDRYMKLAAAADEEYLQFQFAKRWDEKQFCRSDLIELLGIMKKFKHLKNLGICKHIFKKEENKYNAIPKICKFFFSICEELDDHEVNALRHNLFPEISKEMCGEELICSMLRHEKIRCDDFSLLKESLAELKRDDLISKIEKYENQPKSVPCDIFYPIRQPTVANPSGLALIINQKKFTESEFGPKSLDERKGSDVDHRQLKELWHLFGFKVEDYENLTENQFHLLLDSLSKRDLHKSYDVFVICIMSHGKKGCFYSSECKAIDIDSFIANIADIRCMLKKPKLFFIQACQGEQHNEGVPLSPQLHIRRSLSTDSRPEAERVAKLSDTFKAVATVDNYVSYRDEEDGSWFISHLVKNVSEYGDKEDIQQVLTRVIDCISTENALYNNQLFKQLPVQTSTLRKRVVLKRVLTEAV